MSKQKTPPAYGGQAVVEGVMFGGRKNYVTAIRRNDGSIDFFKLPRVPNAKLSALKKIPFCGESSPSLRRAPTAQSI